MSLIEMLVAAGVLAIGVAGFTVLLLNGMMSNNRNRRDTSSTLLAQAVTEEIVWAVANNAAAPQMRDCMGNAFNITTTGGALPAGSGAPTTASGDIDFTKATVGGYSMTYNVCRANNVVVQYDVRWNVANLDTAGATVYTRRVTVAARAREAINGAGANTARLFAFPATLRTIAASGDN
jgi:Tfp pilus assembly protein PilV